MPILWPRPEVLRDPHKCSVEFNSRFTQNEDQLFLIPPAIGGQWAGDGMSESSLPRKTSPLYRQGEKLKLDWDVVSKVFPSSKLSEYTYYWLIVNTRSFYFDELGGDVPENHDDRMILCPFVDYFNHNDRGVSPIDSSRQVYFDRMKV